jgi:hypothetical protein
MKREKSVDEGLKIESFLFFTSIRLSSLLNLELQE